MQDGHLSFEAVAEFFAELDPDDTTSVRFLTFRDQHDDLPD